MTTTSNKKLDNLNTNRNEQQVEQTNNAPIPSFVTQVARPTDSPTTGNGSLLPVLKPSKQTDEDSEESSVDLNAIQVNVAPVNGVNVNKQGIASPSSPKSKNKILNYFIKSISWCFNTNGQQGGQTIGSGPQNTSNISTDKKDEEIETVEEETRISMMTTKKVVKRTSKNSPSTNEEEDGEVEEEETQWSSTKTTKKKKVHGNTSTTTTGGRQPTPTAPTPTNKPFTPSKGIKYLLPEQTEKNRGRKCLVLDLDETLVHSCFQPIPNPDFVIPIEIEGTKHMVYVLKRPFVDDFMLEMSKVFEIVIFTASLSKYANPLLDQLDKHNTISARLFREHCTFIDNCYIKDLSRLGRDITQSLIIDNSPTCYALQPQNAMAVSSWFDDKKDTQLQQMIPWLVKMKEEKDVYETLQEYRVYYSQNGWNGNQQW